ncbi:uncharacterized protein N7458_004706 [Penicillium daleae]|uniref:FAD dependent oxidoreductase domain-containing protein n=1 Tax=Penicillium daleae TaxID=63821 RepID=A0AAD6C6Z7_9EURO|nr:uncharacterized protein N7458_004706 [Penicillium daleae]KAJ5453750.1 hypothetical protein N7458_004706 [Penicillium daleae]
MALPSHIVIVGGGVFGLSTALALTKRHPESQITVVDRGPIPDPAKWPVDNSRIVRADYANVAYSKLATIAIERWRNTDWGRNGRYTQNGLLLMYPDDGTSTKEYARKSYDNVKPVGRDNVEFLPSKADILRAFPTADSDRLDVAGGYVNWGAGLSDVTASLRFVKEQLDREGKVVFHTGYANRVLYDSPDDRPGSKPRATGVALYGGLSIHADLVILATGSKTWTGLVSLRDGTVLTSRATAFMRVSDEEQRELENLPTIHNIHTGICVLPPRDNCLKIARCTYIYRHETPVNASEEDFTFPGNVVPILATDAFRTVLKQLLPQFADRSFSSLNVSRRAESPKADFTVSYHPAYEGLFLAIGCSEHVSKFFPVIGDKVVDALEGSLELELRDLWAWTGGPVPVSNGEDGEDRF